MIRIALALLLSASLAAAEAEAKAEPHAEPFVGRTSTVPLISGGKEAGQAEFTFGPELIESKWLAAQGFPAVPYTAESIAKTAKGIHWRVGATLTNKKGAQLIFSASIKSEMYNLEGNLSLISKSGEVQTFTFKGQTKVKEQAKKK